MSWNHGTSVVPVLGALLVSFHVPHPAVSREPIECPRGDICVHSGVTLQSTTPGTSHQHIKGDFGFFQDSIFPFQCYLAYYLLIAKYYFSSKGGSKPCSMKPLQNEYNLENCTQLSSSQVAHYQKTRKWSSMILQD